MTYEERQKQNIDKYKAIGLDVLQLINEYEQYLPGQYSSLIQSKINVNKRENQRVSKRTIRLVKNFIIYNHHIFLTIIRIAKNNKDRINKINNDI